MMRENDMPIIDSPEAAKEWSLAKRDADYEASWGARVKAIKEWAAPTRQSPRDAAVLTAIRKGR
jgi:hypothetical protein